MEKFRISRMVLIFVIVATLIIGSSSFSFAGTDVEGINYTGSGNVTITFINETKYDDIKITVKDNKGKFYQNKITKKSTKGISFRILNYATGKVYKISVEGYRDGKANTSMKIISKKTAISTAKRKAKILGATEFSKVNAVGTTYKSTAVWRVTFTSNGSGYTYHIQQQTGNVLRWDKEKK